MAGFSGLEVLDISNTPVDSLDALKDLTLLRTLQCSDTQIKNLKPLAGLLNLTLLDFTKTPVTEADPLENCKKLVQVTFNDTKVNSLNVFNDMPALTKIYCNNTLVTQDMAIQFTLKHPSVLVIFESSELIKWWNAMSPEWKKVFNLYRRLDDPPTSEQLHGLLVIDSINVNGPERDNDPRPGSQADGTPSYRIREHLRGES